MPRLPIDFQKGIIYKLCCNDTDIKDCYVGSTTDFIRRKSQHKQSCNNPNNTHYKYKVYECIRQNGGFENWDMVMVEKYPCETKLELHTRERYWIETLETKLNSRLSQRTQKEYREDNKDEIAQKNKQYREDNKDEIAQKKKEYREDNKDEIAQKKKQWREDNKEVIKEIQSIYYQKNKDTILEKLKETMTCECGTIVRKSDLVRHRRSNKHLKYLQDGIVISYSHNSKNSEKITCECGCEIIKRSIVRHRKSDKHLKLLELKRVKEEE